MRFTFNQVSCLLKITEKGLEFINDQIRVLTLGYNPDPLNMMRELRSEFFYCSLRDIEPSFFRLVQSKERSLSCFIPIENSELEIAVDIAGHIILPGGYRLPIVSHSTFVLAREAMVRIGLNDGSNNVRRVPGTLQTS